MFFVLRLKHLAQGQVTKYYMALLEVGLAFDWLGSNESGYKLQPKKTLTMDMWRSMIDRN